VLLVGASRALATEFTIGAQAAAGEPGATGSRASANASDVAWGRAFRGRRGRSFVRKELLLVRRDPLLLARCTTQLLSVFPDAPRTFWADRTIGLVSFA
jgi:hypothetical protein